MQGDESFVEGVRQDVQLARRESKRPGEVVIELDQVDDAAEGEVVQPQFPDAEAGALAPRARASNTGAQSVNATKCMYQGEDAPGPEERIRTGRGHGTRSRSWRATSEPIAHSALLRGQPEISESGVPAAWGGAAGAGSRSAHGGRVIVDDQDRSGPAVFALVDRRERHEGDLVTRLDVAGWTPARNKRLADSAARCLRMSV